MEEKDFVNEPEATTTEDTTSTQEPTNEEGETTYTLDTVTAAMGVVLAVGIVSGSILTGAVMSIGNFFRHRKLMQVVNIQQDLIRTMTKNK